MGRFATTAEFYARFRPPYPPEFFRTLAQQLKLSKRHALIDIGTGPGLLALGFAPYVGRVTAVDPEAAMIAAAHDAAARAGHDIHLIEGRAEDLPAGMGRFDVITVGRALHWIERSRFEALFDRLVASAGAIVICGSSSVADGRNAWLAAFDAARRAWSDAALWETMGKGQHTHRDLMRALEAAGFGDSERVEVEFTHRIGIGDLARRVLTFSSSSPAVLGNRQNEMLADVEARLMPFSHDGFVIETAIAAADIVRRLKDGSGRIGDPRHA